MSIERERLPVLHRHEEEEEEGEDRKGGKRKRVLWRNQKNDPETEERAREKGKQFCQLKPLFQLQKAAFFFVIPLVISADIRTQKMWVSEGVVLGGEISPSSGKFQKTFYLVLVL